jgi:transposase
MLPDVLVVVSTGLSHSQLTQLRNELKQQGVGHQGRSHSETDLTRAVHGVGVLQQQLHLSLNQSVNLIAATELATPRTIRTAYTEFSSSGSITPPSSEHRGCGNPDHPLHPDKLEGLPLEAELTLHRHLHDARENNTYESVPTLLAALRQENSHNTSESTLKRWLHSQGYSYGKKRLMGTMPVAHKNQRMRAFVCAYARALREERAGTAVIVYTDESYIHTLHSTKFCWAHESDRDVRGVDKGGQRLIIIHAMTKHGLMEVPGSEEENYNDLTHPCLSAGFVFQSAGVNDDYHTAITGSSWVAWLNNRLIPTFKALFPGKKMILCLDNAKYHHARPANWISPTQMSQLLCRSFFEAHHITHITAQRDDNAVSLSVTSSAPPNKRAKLPEMKEAIRLHLLSHPDINVTLPQRAMRALGWQLLYTPPYVPEVQPIELVWATVKQMVARQGTSKRKIEECRSQTEKALDQLSADACLARITHCQNYISEWLRTSSADQLQQYKDLDDVIQRLPDSEIKNTTESQLDDDVDEIEGH